MRCLTLGFARRPILGAVLLLAAQIMLTTYRTSPATNSPAWGAEVAIPELALWESQMITDGQQVCDYLTRTDLTLDQRLAHTYYDQVRVMHQIADYTGHSSWDDCALRARSVYRDQYVLPNNGSVPGYWNFTTGLRLDYERAPNPESRTGVLLLAENAAYAADYTPLEWTESHERGREVAYAILSYINAEALGATLRARRIDLVNQAYGHMEQWFVTFAWRGTSVQFSPFIVALTANSLIRDWEETADPRLIPALKLATDYLWAEAWVAENEAMRYQLNPDSPEGGGRSTTGSPDLNLLIAPMYAFLYWQTGDTKYRDQGDLLFAGGAKGAWLTGGKQFDQNYWWSFDYVTWRTHGPSGSSVPTPLAVSITSPTSGQTVSGSVTIATAVPDSTAVTRIDYLADNRVIGTLSPPAFKFQWRTSGGSGSHMLSARVWDFSGASATSTPVRVTVVNPVPVATAMQPTSVSVGSLGFTLTVTGADFLSSSVIRWNGARRPTTFVSATELEAAISARDVRKAGRLKVTVVTARPGGGQSSPLTFTIVGGKPIPIRK